MINEKTREYYNLTKKNEVREAAKKLRRQFLRYKDAEIVYSMSHKMLLEHASKAGAIYRMEATVLINRDIFDEYLEQFLQFTAAEANAENMIAEKDMLAAVSDAISAYD